MEEYRILILPQAQEDKQKIWKDYTLRLVVDNLLEVLRENPFRDVPSYHRLCGCLEGLYSRRINWRHSLVYRVDEDRKAVLIVSMWNREDSK